MKLKIILKQLMKANDLTLAKLSKSTGVPKQTIHNWLTGTEPKNLSHLKKVATYFDLSIDELCYGENLKQKGPESLGKYRDEIYAGIFEVVLRRVRKDSK